MTYSSISPMPWILPFQAPQAASALGIQLVGGKGANLARLAQAGFPVPPGVLVTTRAYRDFIELNQIEAQIIAGLPPENSEDPALLEEASARIRALFIAGKMPDRLAADLQAAYLDLGQPPVAVRSSATAEDLPEMSFAGQQDTYLNILGIEKLLAAVVDCWASLWTARAIGYRLRNHVPQAGAALAVVIQKMVESQSSGVLFTANPLTGLRSETVIDATFGLGEALVSGKVEPDHYVVDAGGDAIGSQIVSKTLGAKALSIHGQSGGGTQTAEADRKTLQALPDPQILALTRLGQEVAALFSFPQDIEWAWAGEQLYLLQSRPITSLFPTPPELSADPLKAFFSFAAIQGMLDPMTPLGRDMIRQVFAMGRGLFGIQSTAETQTILYSAGERLWVNFTTLLRNSVGRRAVYGALGIIEPTIKQAVMEISAEPRLQPERSGIRPRAMLQIVRFAFPMVGNMALNLISPRKRREKIVAAGEQILADMRAGYAGLTGDRHARLAQQIDLFESMMEKRLRPMLRLFLSGVAAAMASFNALRELASGLPDQAVLHDTHSWSDLVLEITRGLPHNPTTEMDLALWEAAQSIRREPPALQDFQSLSSAELADRYRSGGLSAPTRRILDPFIEKYGGRGLAEIDMGRPRWFEDATHVFEMLSSYLQIENSAQAPDVVFARGAESADAAVNRLVEALRRMPRGWFKVRLARFMASRVRELMGIRESPKFFAVRLFGVLRKGLLTTGAEFVTAGELDRADDLFYLTFAELKALAANEARDWRALIAQRREVYNREMLRRQVPRLLLSDGRAFYEGMRAVTAGGMSGSPVSPGSAEGRVRVVIDPRQANMLPGEILVCPGTDPSWTPLFLSAGGLIMEVGGMMTHGAVVAREYGIPAIVGVDQATQRLRTGQLIHMNGSTGQIEVLDSAAPGPDDLS